LQQHERNGYRLEFAKVTGNLFPEKQTFTYMKKIIFTLIFFCVNVSKIFSINYFEFQSTGTTNTLKSITFINQNTGVCVGNFSTILHTSNGGTNWVNIDISNSAAHYTSVAFANATTGFITSDSGHLIKTTNGGLNWTISNFSPNPLRYIYFFNSSLGFVGGANTLYKTTNGGENWINVTPPGFSEIIVKIVLYDNDFGFFLTREYLNPGSVFKTTNGGTNWQKLENFYSGYTGEKALFDCVPLNRDTVYIALGYYQTGIMRTTNGGTNWQHIYNQFNVYTYPGSFYELVVLDRNNIIAMNGPTDGAPCYLVKSTNGGFNFTHPSAIRLAGYMYDGFFFRNTYAAYFCGESGIIIKLNSFITNVSSQTENIINKDKFTISPNPGGDFISILPDENSDYSESGGEIIIYDLSGKQVHNAKINNFQNVINISHLPKSVYFIKVKYNNINSVNEYYIKKFVKIF